MSSLEAVFQKKVLRKLKDIPNSMFFTKEAVSIRGISDILGVCNGKFIALELKRSESEANKKTGRIVLQKYFLQQVNDKGGYGALVHPANLGEIILKLHTMATEKS